MKRIIGAAAAVAALAIPTMPAHAADSTTTTVTRGMQIVGYDRSVATAHGYTIKTDSEGHEYSVKNGSVQPNTSVTDPGDCGSSTATITHIGNHQATVSTGFVLSGIDGFAVDYNWNLSVLDNWGQTPHHWGGGLATRRSWSSQPFNFKSAGAGPAWAIVESGSSYAILIDGGVCYSAGPAAEDYID
ncbi:hypothetical protein [Streptomyces sp. NPDC021020]|uniref:hypothetical protein n=1 Tax=Streptomyces sp. NPDC021020 TaxID=3365109 RepID=UPI0037BC521C